MKRYIPENSNEMIFDNVNAVVYTREIANAFYAIGYSGKRGKHDFHYKFKNNENMQKYISEWVARLEEIKSYKGKVQEEKKIKRANFKHELKVGDILYTSWGYDQTNIDFYQIVELIGKSTAKIRQIGEKIVGNEQGHSMSATKIAIKDAFLPNEKEMTKRICQLYTNDACIRISSFETAFIWDGRPKNYNWYG